MKHSIILFAILTICGCNDFRISRSEVLEINNADEWHQKTPEIIFVAIKSDLEVINQLAIKIPMATKDDCTCCSGGPADAAGVVIQRLYELDPEMKIVQKMNAIDRSHFYRYCRILQLIDWIDPEIAAQQGDAPEPATKNKIENTDPFPPAR